MSKRLKITLLIILTILLVGCGTATELDSDSDEWKTFTNEKFGYSFEVPAFCYEGPLPGDCKQSPPEERPDECLCHIDGTDPEFVGFQKFTITSEETSLATILIMSPGTPAYSPDEGTDLISFIQQEFSEMYPDEIPSGSNMELNGLPALLISIAGSPGVADYQEILFIKENKLFKISLIDTLIESNMKIYDRILASFAFSK